MGQEILPIGSIVTLKDNDAKILIVGLYSVVYDKNIIVYDYQGCSYPEGLTLSDKIYSFNTTDVDKVIHRGYEDEEFTNLRDRLVDGPYEETEDDFIMDALENDDLQYMQEDDLDQNLEEVEDEELIPIIVDDIEESQENVENSDENKKNKEEDLEILVFD